jgi:L-seryl-tRNA(Ser) seleniumtransferase
MKTTPGSELYRKLPSVDEVMRASEIAALVAEEGHAAVADAVRVVLGALRNEITAGTLDRARVELAVAGICDAVRRELRRALMPSLRPVINATGVVLHTNLGRAPLSASAIDHIRETATAYSNLEFDIEQGERGKRDVHVNGLFKKLLGSTPSIGSEPGAAVDRSAGPELSDEVSTIVVNNNAAAVLLALNTMAEGGEVIVSRGELVEIGGSFRIPDVMTKSGAVLREVGTTNRTRISDYERAINERTRLILRVHRSNFQITGFTEQPSLSQLVALGRKRNIPVMEDLGSGAFFDFRLLGISGEPGVPDSLRAGVDIVTYSGDKLLGGPQAGILSGRPEQIRRIRSNPMFRALRVDKLTYAALEATLLAYVKRDHKAIPAIAMMSMSASEVRQRAELLAGQIGSAVLTAEVIDGESVIGGGAAPSAVLPTALIALTSNESSAEEVAARLRTSDPPIIVRVEEDRVLLDLRTVFPEQDAAIAAALSSRR